MLIVQEFRIASTSWRFYYILINKQTRPFAFEVGIWYSPDHTSLL